MKPTPSYNIVSDIQRRRRWEAGSKLTLIKLNFASSVTRLVSPSANSTVNSFCSVCTSESGKLAIVTAKAGIKKRKRISRGSWMSVYDFDEEGKVVSELINLF
jgi:hypothetical protein